MKEKTTIKNKYLLVIAGPTAAGKTNIAIELAKIFDTEIISADSRQIYKEMTIGTAKPSKKEQSRVKHHFINSLSVSDPYSAGQYEKDVLALLTILYKDNDIAIMAGGTGLYIDAALQGLDEFPQIPQSSYDALEKEMEEKGIIELQKRLAGLDPDYYNQVDKENSRRLIRAIAVSETGGQPYSFYLKRKNIKREFTPIPFILNLPREILYERINTRVVKMVAAGLEQEAKDLLPFRELRSLDTVGYREMFSYLDGNLSKEDTIKLIKRNTRRYAKRQLTWFRKKESWPEFEPSEIEKIIAYIRQSIEMHEQK